MSKRNEVVKEITDILQLADSLVGLVYLFKINRKTNKLIDKQREQNNAMINSLLVPMKKDTKNVIYLVERWYENGASFNSGNRTV